MREAVMMRHLNHHYFGIRGDDLIWLSPSLPTLNVIIIFLFLEGFSSQLISASWRSSSSPPLFISLLSSWCLLMEEKSTEEEVRPTDRHLIASSFGWSEDLKINKRHRRVHIALWYLQTSCVFVSLSLSELKDTVKTLHCTSRLMLMMSLPPDPQLISCTIIRIWWPPQLMIGRIKDTVGRFLQTWEQESNI